MYLQNVHVHYIHIPIHIHIHMQIHIHGVYIYIHTPLHLWFNTHLRCCIPRTKRSIRCPPAPLPLMFGSIHVGCKKKQFCTTMIDGSTVKCMLLGYHIHMIFKLGIGVQGRTDQIPCLNYLIGSFHLVPLISNATNKGSPMNTHTHIYI